MSVDKKNKRISKALTFHLRHGGERHGLPLDSQGWADVESLLAMPQFSGVDIATIKNIVLSCPKQRFALKEEENKLYIRANQGHSLKNVQVDLEELTASTIPEILIHGTYEQYWNSIKSQGLSRMTRQHIHLATGITGAPGTISGVRATCDIHIYVDGLRALTDGYKFFKSANNVILCPGDDRGFLPPSYFARVVNAKSGADVPLL